VTPFIALLIPSIAFANQADNAVARYAKAMKAMPGYEVTFTYKAGGKPEIKGSLIVDHNKRLRYDALSGPTKYILSITPALYREVDFHMKEYEEFPYQGGFSVFPSDISPLQISLPMWLKVPTLNALIPRTAKFQFVNSRKVGNQTCDHLHTEFQTNEGSGTIDLDIANDGLIYRFNRVTVMRSIKNEETWSFDRYKPSSTFADSRFDNEVPQGFAPYALEYHDGPTEVGSKLNLLTFVDSRSLKPIAVPKGKPILLLVVGHDSLPGRNALSAARGWSAVLAQNGVSLLAVSAALRANQAEGLPFDPSQTTMRLLSPPATPLFYLLDKSGKLTNVWMGYHPTEAAKLKSDILKAISELR